jgi:high affinity Mn2+ porin
MESALLTGWPGATGCDIENMRKQAQFVNLSARWLMLAFWAAFAAALPSLAQQPDAPAGAKVGTASQTATANENDPPSDPPSGEGVETMFPHFKDTRFWLSGQMNFIFQTHPTFPAAYSGAHSLGPDYEKATSRVLTLYTGVRLNNSTEILVDIEEAGGAALSQGFGLAGNTDLDIVRNPSLSKAPYVARAMIHKVFALSKDKIESQRSPLSLFEELPRRRLEIRFGKFSMVDFFDVNSVGSDTHFQFTNWTVDNNGAYDYAADTRGYTVGATADYEDRNWGFRFAEALLPKVANGIDLVWRPWQVHQLCQHGDLSPGSGQFRSRPHIHSRHRRPSLAHHSQVRIRREPGAESHAVFERIRPFRVG